MHRSRLIELLAKKKAGEISLQDQFELTKWLQENEEDRALVESLDEVFSLEMTAVTSDENKQAKENSWDRIMGGLPGEYDGDLPSPNNAGAGKYRRFRYWAPAAAVILLLAGTAFYYMNTEKKGDKLNQNIVGTQKGSRSNLTLPDGTRVWLNSDSKITYGASFGKRERELTLTGEAYFDVARDMEHPMIIHTPTITVKVLGTTFNLRAYPDEKNTVTTLVTGSVKVTLNNRKDQSYTLKPDEKLVVKNEGGEITGNESRSANPAAGIARVKIDKADSIPPEAQWIKNKLVFINKPLDELAVILSRWYGVQITVEGGDKMKAREYTGIFENQSIQGVLESLRLAGGFNYKIVNNTIVIEP